jgi:hypothetical protein
MFYKQGKERGFQVSGCFFFYHEEHEDREENPASFNTA